ncbi:MULTISPECIES: nitrite reductase small subunit NirD [Psychrobacter]|jgi:nitrite reductase (NADH) small subunit|uniref:nitrite reductase small subunit NirD n=1 Tax=Psychrobacter TaxID=497 RepID=UPI00248C5622|nr:MULTISPECIES: nitrite reductase small subunit NirD [Psychrobacter]WGV14104.1 nitrite reductase small subunit NirD [Psychrobacter sp. WB2]WLW67556.1 nitrite reductase small subunit NirD [Psychrobacter sp. van23A]
MNQYVVCRLEDILPETGVCALIEGKQVAIFRTKDNKLFALDNYDPFSQANVLSRGLVGGTTVTNDGGIDEAVLYVASPIYKQRFNIATGQCLDDNSVMLATYNVELDISFEGNDVIIKYEQLETSSTTLLEIEAV